ncbi:MAG: TrkA family potassium uptake protein [Candidatus Omnitrophota bacterium]
MYIIIVGCSRVGSELAALLSAEGHNVVIIDRDPKALRRLGANFNGQTIIGNGFALELLKSAGIEKADAFCAVTNGDNTNLMAAQVAKKIFNVPKVVTRVYDPHRADIYKLLGIEVISGTILFASMLRDKIIESRFSSYIIETKELGLMEVRIKGKFINKKIKQIILPGDFIAIAVQTKNGITLATADLVLEKDNLLTIIVKTTSLDKVKSFFELKK